VKNWKKELAGPQFKSEKWGQKDEKRIILIAAIQPFPLG